MVQDQTDFLAGDRTLDGMLMFHRGVLPAFVFDRATLRFLDVNAAASRHYGWSREEFLAMTLLAIRPPAEHERLRRYIASPERGERDFGPWLHWKKNGTLMEVQVHGVDLPFAGRECRLATVFDVTHVNATARALRDSEARLRTVIEEMPVMFNALDDDGVIVFWNREAERISGYSKDEVVGNPRFFEIAYPDKAYRESMVEEWRCRGNAYRDWEWVMTCKDGAQRVIAWSNASARTRIPGWAAWGVGIDVTRRREAEARMETLSRRVLAVQEEERRAVSLELHDAIGQALTAIKLNLEGLLRRPDAARAPAALEDSIALVEGAIGEVRSLAYALRPQILDDMGLAHALGWLAERTRDRSGLAVTADVAVPEPAVDATISAACFRIAQEALTNVVRHSSATQVHVSLAADASALVLTIQDDGHGFDIGAVQVRARRGDGLGVPGMEERARLAGGRLEIQATAGSGTRICAVFPREMGKT
jgi:PAS domain S-box-containing protein